MLPEHLSADLCSLKQGVDRACLAVRMVFDANGKKRRNEFMRGVMRSAARLTYAQAQRAFDGKPDAAFSAETHETLAALWKAYGVLTKERASRDPLDLDLPERRISIGADGKIASIAFKERLESMRLIEEFMVLANVAAAETLEKARMPPIYRVHEEPSKEKLFAFGDYLKTIGFSFAKGQVLKPGVFDRILAGAKGTPHEAVMNDVVLRTQAQAVYAPNNVGHFGLNLQRYAHFTSPIRRYADLIVHRGLIRALKEGEGGLTDREIARLTEISEHISATERRAMAAERDSTDRYVAAFMEDRIGAVFDARITGVTRFGVFVRLADTGAEGLLPARALGTEYFRHDERRHAMVGERTGTVYALGDTVSVRLAEAAPLTGGLRFELAEAAAPKPRRRHRPSTEQKAAMSAFDADGETGHGAMRPKDAATLILVKHESEPRVLMGQRRQSLAFMAGKFVFPGGRVDPSDRRLAVGGELRPDVLEKLNATASAARARGLALAAIRETYEETGVLVGTRTDQTPRTRSAAWAKFLAHGVVPKLNTLDLVARAITPPGRSRRFDTWFFMADASAIALSIESSADGELLKPCWLTFAESRALDLPAITRRVLEDVEARFEGNAGPVPFFYVSRGKLQSRNL